MMPVARCRVMLYRNMAPFSEASPQGCSGAANGARSPAQNYKGMMEHKEGGCVYGQ